MYNIVRRCYQKYDASVASIGCDFVGQPASLSLSIFRVNFSELITIKRVTYVKYKIHNLPNKRLTR